MFLDGTNMTGSSATSIFQQMHLVRINILFLWEDTKNTLEAQV